MRSFPAAVAALSALAFTPYANALYYIDDQDPIITYNSSAGVGYNSKWLKYSFENSNGLAVSVNESLCFGGTATYTQCLTADNCSMTIPFNGTGITLYVAQDTGDIYNTSISLDGGPPTNHFAYNDIKPQTEAYNATLYDIQNLTWTTHTVHVEIAPDGKRLLFDYAVVTGDPPLGRNGANKAAAFSISTSPSIVASTLFLLAAIQTLS